MNKKIAFALAAAVAFAAPVAPAFAASGEPVLQASYSTDKFLTCDALADEGKRMDFFITTKGVDAATVKTAQERKKIIGAILKEKTTCAKQAKDFGPGMYD